MQPSTPDPPNHPEAALPGPVWTAEELAREFEVLGSSASTVIVMRRKDNRLGSVRRIGQLFTDWREDFDARGTT